MPVSQGSESSEDSDDGRLGKDMMSAWMRQHSLESQNGSGSLRNRSGRVGTPRPFFAAFSFAVSFLLSPWLAGAF